MFAAVVGGGVVGTGWLGGAVRRRLGGLAGGSTMTEVKYPFATRMQLLGSLNALNSYRITQSCTHTSDV